MDSVGNISLPIVETTKAVGGDIDMLDIMFDTKIPMVCKALKDMHNADYPMMLILKARDIKAIFLLLFKPPDILTTIPNQDYQVYAAPSMQALIHYFVMLTTECDPFEHQVYTGIIGYLKRVLNEPKINYVQTPPKGYPGPH
jgi:hypothetical protein